MTVGRSSSRQMFGSTFGVVSDLSSAFFRSSTQATAALAASGPGLLSHDVILWLGDLNYRLNLPEEAIMPLLRERRLDLLLHFDQLSICKKAGEIFQGFEEPPIDFFPVCLQILKSTLYSDFS